MVIKKFDGKIGEEYELFKLSCPHFDKLENTVGKIIKKEYKNKKNKTINVLEIGTGPGYTTLIILDSDNRTNVVSVDNESLMTKQAEKILSTFIINNRVKLVTEDGLKFLKKQSNESFDIFASGFTLHNFNKSYREKVIKEIYRILKPKGIFINADKYALDNKSEHIKSLNYQLQQFKDQYSKINRPDLTKEWTKHYLEDNEPEVIMKENDSIQFMKKVGFKDIKIVLRIQMEAVFFAKKIEYKTLTVELKNTTKHPITQ
ncbi:MAG: hypothetical protein CL685_03370 [Candidatus Magasanikbacteria bacterium]|nr:hypothetical protein [Candidatus Magasanikbacteria bacterium]